jgi:hypothetical protein
MIMVTLTRRQARCLRGVLRRARLAIAHRGPVPPLLLHADGPQLRAQHRYAVLAIEYATGGDLGPGGAVALPLDALAEFEGNDDVPVTLEAAAPDRTTARWSDHGVPQHREYAVPRVESLASFPDPPAAWAEAPPALLDALAEASATAADDSPRYALGCLRLGGDGGAVAATDGRQLLIQGGFAFPWEGARLVRCSPVFAAQALPRDRPLQVGATGTHVALRAGPWTLFLEVQAGVRFPRVEEVVPAPGSAAARLRLDPADAAFLAAALGRLPGGGQVNAPVTVELNGRVAVRAREEGGGPATELVLSRSGYAGEAAQVATDRRLLTRAVALGFTDIELSGPTAPLVCRDGPRTFAWQPLAEAAVIEPSDDVERIASGAADARRVVPGGKPAGGGRTNRVRGDRPAPDPGRADPPHAVGAEVGGGAGLAALIAEAEALTAGLGEERARAGRLAVALRRHRRRERQLAATLAALRQLRLPEPAA